VTWDDGAVSEFGLIPYDLMPVLCTECQQPVTRRLFGYPAGCATCDDVITSHRCTGRPAVLDHHAGDHWECPECRSVWLVVKTEDPCPECGQPVTEHTWQVAHVGERIAMAPRYKPVRYTPFRNVLARPSPCYSLPGGSRVHVRPGCRC
jgi:hypothetical protein